MSKSPRRKIANAEYQRQRVAAALEKGLCARCTVRPLLTKRMCRECRLDENATQTIRVRQLRIEILDAYGAPTCNCCKETFDYEFLHIDHVNGGGNEHKRGLTKRNTTNVGDTLLYWLRNNGYPAGFQVLCANCNMAKGAGICCPHQSEPKHLSAMLTGLMGFGC